MRRRDVAAVFLSAPVAHALQHAHKAAADRSKASLTYLSAATAAELEALAAQIVPSGDTPGAREAGVIFFIDRALATFARHERQAYREGLAAVQAKRKELFPASVSIVSLSAADATELLRAIETSQFFELLRTHTIMGYLGNPSLGGNRGRAGWQAIGFEDRHGFQTPFGYYDDPKNGPV